MINQSLLLAGDDAYNLTRSLRFRKSANGLLNRTFATNGTSRQTVTLSIWTKRGQLGTSQYLAGAYNGSSASSTNIIFNSSDQLNIDFGGSSTFSLTTTQVFRDPSAWYHIVVVFDTTQATASNRVKLYVNGVQVTAFGTANYPSQNADGQLWNATSSNCIGSAQNYGSPYDGYMADINFIDGQALTPSSFGETDVLTGVWKPKKYAGTYGTNGFYLPFTDVALTSGSNAGVGKDFSGNANYWDTINISVTTGTTYDSMTDVPTMSALASNYATLNPLAKGAITLSNGNLTAVGDGGNYDNVPSTISFDAASSTGMYAEFYCVSNDSDTVIGICSPSNASLSISNPTYQFSYYADGYGLRGDGQKKNNNINASYGTGWSGGDIISIAVRNGKLYFARNGTWMNSGDLSAETGYAYSGLTGQFVFVIAINSTYSFHANFGQRPFSYTPPTGFVSLNTFNLPEPSIKAGNKHFDILTWSGTGGSAGATRSLTGLNFQPSFSWKKARTSGQSHHLFDSVRGAGLSKTIASDSTNAEGSFNDTLYGYLSSFDATGITTTNGSSSWDNWNKTGDNYVAWNWKANGAGSSNTAGSITSTVSANPTAGFSVVTYTGNGSGSAQTVGHGLGVAPSMYIVKNRTNASDWKAYHAYLNGGSSPAGYSINLNNTGAQASSTLWNSTAPTSSVFTINGTGNEVNQSGSAYVAYCFAEVAGYSKFGSYTGNGSTDGTFVHLGFRPKFVMIKISSGGSGNWEIFDTSRNTYNQMDLLLLPSSSATESNAYGSYYIDATSNGFKVRGSGLGFNGSGETLIYAAFAENPQKYALAR